jgi:hypothetical protein
MPRAYFSRMSDTEFAVEKQRPAHWFKPGQSGNPLGRKKGSRNALATDFLRAMAEDFAKNGAEAIRRVRDEKPDVYLKVCADLIPRELTVDASVDVLHDASSLLECFRTMNSLLGSDPDHGLARLRKLAPQIDHHE